MRIVKLQSGGWISLETRVDLFTITFEDRTYIESLVAMLDAYEAALARAAAERGA